MWGRVATGLPRLVAEVSLPSLPLALVLVGWGPLDHPHPPHVCAWLGESGQGGTQEQ